MRMKLVSIPYHVLCFIIMEFDEQKFILPFSLDLNILEQGGRIFQQHNLLFLHPLITQVQVSSHFLAEAFRRAI